MATTSTVPTCKSQLVTTFTAALGAASQSGGQVQVAYAWPGAKTEAESVFLGRHPKMQDLRLDIEQDIPTIKAGRKQRRENYTVETTIWVFRPDLTVAAASTCESRAFTLLGHLEDELADDPTLGTSYLQHAKAGQIRVTLWPFEKGWASEIILDVDVQARLT